MTTQEIAPDPFEIFGSSKLERIINSAIKECIRVHGAIDVQGVPSVSKRAANQLRAYFQQFTAQILLDESSKQLLTNNEKACADLKIRNTQLMSQVVILGEALRKIRDSEVSQPAECAAEAIIQSREIRKEKNKCVVKTN